VARKMRGLGEDQINQRTKTNYRIMLYLYKEPYSYEQLWRTTRIHRNTLHSRVKDLVDRNIVIKLKYPFRYRSGRRGFRNHDFYLLNWDNEKVRDIVSFLFENGEAVMMSHDSILLYRINSIEVNSQIERRSRIYIPRDYRWKDLSEKLNRLFIKESEILQQLKQYYARSDRLTIEKRKLLEERDKMLEESILECSKYFSCKLGRHALGDSYNVLVHLKLISFFNRSRPYVKIWQIMGEMGF
jgi:DNA-binding Lrp family transcriptional regulator